MSGLGMNVLMIQRILPVGNFRYCSLISRRGSFPSSIDCLTSTYVHPVLFSQTGFSETTVWRLGNCRFSSVSNDKEKPSGSNTRLKSDNLQPPILAASEIVTRDARIFRSSGFFSFCNGLDKAAIALIL